MKRYRRPDGEGTAQHSDRLSHSDAIISIVFIHHSTYIHVYVNYLQEKVRRSGVRGRAQAGWVRVGGCEGGGRALRGRVPREEAAGREGTREEGSQEREGAGRDVAREREAVRREATGREAVREKEATGRGRAQAGREIGRASCRERV